MSLDDDGQGWFAKKREESERRDARMAESGETVPSDFYMVQEILVEYDRCGQFEEAVRRCGGSASECVAAKKMDAEIRLAWDFVEGNIVERMKAKAKDIAQTAQDGLGRAVSDPDCKLNVKALELALAGTMPGLYGKPGRGVAVEEPDDGRRIPVGGGGIMINIIGDAAMKLLKPAVEGKSGGVYIDV